MALNLLQIDSIESIRRCLAGEMTNYNVGTNNNERQRKITRNIYEWVIENFEPTVWLVNKKMGFYPLSKIKIFNKLKKP